MKVHLKELQESKQRIEKLDSIIQRLYEDMISGIISEERYGKLSKTYETKQNQLEKSIL